MLCSHITEDEDPYEIVLKLSKNSSLLRESLYQDIDFDRIREEINKKRREARQKTETTGVEGR